MKFLLTICLLTIYCLGNAQLSFDRITLSKTLDGIESIHSADYDNDGDNDIFTASRNDNQVILFELLSDGNLFPITLTSQLAGASVVKSFDLDMDGDLDIIASGNSPGNHSICWWENIDNNFSAKKTIVNINNQAFNDFDIADFDNDGDNDIISVEFAIAAGPGSLAMWENDNLDFTLRELSDNSIDGRQIEIIDWDNDNDLDFIVGEGIGDKLVYWENLGGYNFSKITFFNYDICNSFDIADLDNDGDRDFVALSFTGDEVSYWLNDGSDNFTKFVIEDAYDAPDKLVLSDMDGDNDLDIIVAFYIEDLLVIYENDGNLGFTKNIIDTDFDGGRDLFIVDLDNDNSPDILGAALSDKKAVIWINNLVISNTVENNLLKRSNLFPNPASNVLFVDNENHSAQQYIILDNTGHYMQSGKYQSSINIEDLPNGIYFLKLIRDDQVETHKIVVAKSHP